MNAQTNPRPVNGSADPSSDKIVSMLRQLDAAAPIPPAFGDLTATAPNGSSRPNRMVVSAAASIVVLGVGGLVVLGTRDTNSVSEQPGVTVPAPNGSVPTNDPSVGTVPEPGSDSLPDAGSVGTAPIDADPTLVGAPLLSAALASDAFPLFELAQPNWVKQSVYSADDEPLGDTRMTTVVFVGDGGPMYDQPFVSLSVFDPAGPDVVGAGPIVEVGGVRSSAVVSEVDPESGLVGPIVNLTVPLGDDLALTVNSVRLSVDETVAIAESVTVATADQIELDAPQGFRRLRGATPDAWRDFSYQWGFDDGTPVPEPVIISTPTAVEEIPQQPTIEVIGQNLGPIGLAGRIGLEVRENRVVNGIDIAYRPMPNQPGMYWADWLDGEWSYYAIGLNLDSEEQFVELLASLQLTDAETFAASGSGVVSPVSIEIAKSTTAVGEPGCSVASCQWVSLDARGLTPNTEFAVYCQDAESEFSNSTHTTDGVGRMYAAELCYYGFPESELSVGIVGVGVSNTIVW